MQAVHKTNAYNLHTKHLQLTKQFLVLLWTINDYILDYFSTSINPHPKKYFCSIIIECSKGRPLWGGIHLVRYVL